MIDLMLSLWNNSFSPRGMTKLTVAMMQQSAAFLGSAMPAHDYRLAWQELGNKLCVFDTFEHVDVILEGV